VIESLLAARDTLASVAVLPEMQREAILLSAVQGRSHQEVAEVLGVSSASVRGLLYRARTALRSAAAAVMPGPLVAWASGAGSRLAPGAAGIAELQATTGGETTALVVKGAALAVAAALAAGAVLTPLHIGSGPGRSSRRTPQAPPATRSGAPIIAALATPGDPLFAGGGGPDRQLHRASPLPTAPSSTGGGSGRASVPSHTLSRPGSAGPPTGQATGPSAREVSPGVRAAGTPAAPAGAAPATEAPASFSGAESQSGGGSFAPAGGSGGPTGEEEKEASATGAGGGEEEKETSATATGEEAGTTSTAGEQPAGGTTTTSAESSSWEATSGGWTGGR
jgi:hypothetical protein